MKIKQLRLKNLNSLYGEWEIDFTDPEYLANGIFAITGATGAGKSTILDAICLALYGATPRLGRITKSSNEIMSRQTGECYAEVVFESQAGSFLCHFEQRRAKKSPSGNLQEPEHQIAHIDGTLIESKKSLVLDVIMAKTGMDFDRFTRSMLLAQGGFDSFLKASLDDKSKILEQITGMEIYSDISKLVFENHKMAKQDYESLKQSTSHLELLSEDALNNLTLQKHSLLTKATELNQSIKLMQQQINWHQDVVRSSAHLNELKQTQLQLLKDSENFASDRLRVVTASKAEQLERHWSPLEALMSTLKEETSALGTLKASIPSLTSIVETEDSKYQHAVNRLVKAKLHYEATLPLINEIKQLDSEIVSKSEVLAGFKLESDTINTTLKTLVEQLENQEKLKANEHSKMVDAKQYMAEQGLIDARLVTNLSGLSAKIQQLDKSHVEHKGLQADLSRFEKQKTTQARLIQLEQEKKDEHVIAIEKLETQIKEKHTALNTLLNQRTINEYRLEKEHLIKERAYIDRIASLESQRALLEDGHPCPLCGAIEHPYSTQATPEIRSIDLKITQLTTLITQLEGVEQDYFALEKQLTLLRQNTTQVLNLIHTLSLELKHIEENIIAIASKIADLTISIDSETHSINLELAEYSEKYEPNQASSLIEYLTKRAKTFEAHNLTLTKGNEILTKIESEILRINTLQASTQTQLFAITDKISQATALVLDLKAKRFEKFASEDPIEKELSLQKALKIAESAEKSINESLILAKSTLASKQQEVALLDERVSKNNKKLETDTLLFLTLCQSVEFHTIEEFLNARMKPVTLQSLKEKAKILDDGLLRIASQIENAEQQHQILLTKYALTQTKLEIESALEIAEEQIKQLNSELISINYQLEKNDQTKIALSELTAKIEQARRIAWQHEKLNSLIGSSDGKKFRGFAQGLTFEIMVHHANLQLQKMNDRYLLQRDSQSPLSLNIIDNYQAGEIRSIKNLSGGESFIVSLALALGLSKMSSQTIRVDSLFLDEGFGTLDEEALDTALDALSTLQKEDKLIGIISHVPALKNRISTQISVDSQNGGRSILSGPSCVRLNKH